ncbi:MAG: KilA-N domain-containing protein [Dolichospermum sp.]
MEAIQIFEYNGQQIEFDLGKANVMINATEMANIFGKKVENFTRIDTTKSFINAALNNANKRYLGIEKEDDLLISKQRTGTWMHRILALKFAAWLDPEFEIWVYLTIDKILFGSIREDIQVKLDISQRKEELKNKFLENPEYLEYLRLEELDKITSSKIKKQQKTQLNLFLNKSSIN